jgi:hypothetical protein
MALVQRTRERGALMCSGSDNPPDVCRSETRRARKEHWCCECGGPIPAGTRYVYTSGVWDGTPDSYKQHAECHELLDWISKRYCDGEPWSFGTLRDEVDEYTDRPTGPRGDFYWGEALKCRMAAIEARYPR